VLSINSMNYYLFIDESGDHGLSNIDKSFPVFVLCGVFMSETEYEVINKSLDAIKINFWSNKKVIFHSRDIRKCDKEFKILLDLDIKQKFYSSLDGAVSGLPYVVLASVINKEDFIKKYGKLKNDVYEIALSFIIERAIFYLDSLKTKGDTLFCIIEERGKREDIQLKKHFETLRNKGTYFLSPERIKTYNLKIEFKNKKQNINGLQLSDLVAYPIARYAMDKERANPAFEIVKPKIYSKGTKKYGLKYFP
jgi:hypothetical protein